MGHRGQEEGLFRGICEAKNEKKDEGEGDLSWIRFRVKTIWRQFTSVRVASFGQQQKKKKQSLRPKTSVRRSRVNGIRSIFDSEIMPSLPHQRPIL